MHCRSPQSCACLRSASSRSWRPPRTCLRSWPPLVRPICKVCARPVSLMLLVWAEMHLQRMCQVTACCAARTGSVTMPRKAIAQLIGKVRMSLSCLPAPTTQRLRHARCMLLMCCATGEQMAAALFLDSCCIAEPDVLCTNAGVHTEGRRQPAEHRARYARVLVRARRAALAG